MLKLILNPSVLALLSLLASVVWMLRDDKDKTRPVLVIALVINSFYGYMLTFVMSTEDGLVPWKYDYILFRLDHSLGVSAAGAAAVLQGWPRISLFVVYQFMIPMMIAWFLVARASRSLAPLIWAYAAEMVAGPLLYAFVPACGPAYAFRGAWLHPPFVAPEMIKLSGMPNAFPSLHLATALLLLFFSHGKVGRTISLVFLAGTALATIATGEHYWIDLVAGAAFGCFAASMGRRQFLRAALFLAIVLTWSIAVRFGYIFLIEHPLVLRAFAACTLAASAAAVAYAWRENALPQASAAAIAEPATTSVA